MWHFHEGVAGPLGSGYKSADQICRLWQDRGATHPSLPILRAALSDANWVAVKGYRDRWNHREYPLIEGEFRSRREVVWKEESDPPPPNVILTHKLAGKVAYVAAGCGNHQYRMPELMDAGTAALRAALVAVEAFL